MIPNQTPALSDIELHIRTYRSLLKASGKIAVEKFIDSHNRMQGLLHEKGESEAVDMAAFIYSLLRLPSCMSSVETVILGQSHSVFRNNGFPSVSRWKEVMAPGRRRKMFYNGKRKLAMYIASVSDVDDIVTLLTAFQIEWNKFHAHLVRATDVEETAKRLLDPDDLSKIQNIWGDSYRKFLTAIKKKRIDFTLQLLSGSYIEYAKATRSWWSAINQSLPRLSLDKRPVYFISSNTHSVTNVLTRFAIGKEKAVIDYLYRTQSKDLIALWENIENGNFKAYRENFLYYLAKKYAKTHPEYGKEKRKSEAHLGIHHVSASQYLDIDVQVIEVAKLAKATLDPRLNIDTAKLANSHAIIVNIDYPLGWAAYQVLTEIGQNVDYVRGVYIMGKAATLNGEIGDILIPTTIFDQHTKNTYVLQNAFSQKDFTDLFKTGLVLDNQKTVTAKGTFLQSRPLIESWYREGFTTIEMEAGPFCNAMYEFVYYNRYVENELINLVNTPFEVGIAHYASDTPYSKAKNLGVRNLSYEGVEPTYATTLAIIKKVIQREIQILAG